MKLKIKKEEILKGLQRIQGVVEKKNTMPILSNMLLTADANGVEIVATDLEIGLRGRYTAEVEKAGSVTLSAKKMYEIVRELPAEDIQIKVEDGGWAKIISGHSQFKLVALPKEDYPALPDVAEEGMIAIEGETLREMIKKTLYSVGENDARYVLNGLFVQMTQGKNGLNIRMVGTDGHRLSMIDRVIEAKHKEESMIIPKKAMMELRRILEEDSSAGRASDRFQQEPCAVQARRSGHGVEADRRQLPQLSAGGAGKKHEESRRVQGTVRPCREAGVDPFEGKNERRQDAAGKEQSGAVHEQSRSG